MSKQRTATLEAIATQTQTITTSRVRPVALVDDVTLPFQTRPAVFNDETTISGRLTRLAKRRSPVA